MSLLILIDGYNVVAPIAPPGRTPDPSWLQRERNQLVRRLAEHLPAEICRRTCVVFDAARPPPDRPREFVVDGITILFAIDYAEADDLIEELIVDHSAPRSLTVVSSDHRVQTAARRRGATAFDAQRWLDKLIDGHVLLAGGGSSRAGQGDELKSDKPKSIGEDDVQQWMEEFGF